MRIIKYHKDQKIPWQYAIANDLFVGEENECLFSSKKMSEKFYVEKKQQCPSFLYKFYAPTIENISDVQNRLLWLSSPDTFNDPYDCRIFFNNDAFQQYYTIRSFKDRQIFSDEEKNTIYRLNTKSTFYLDSFSNRFREIVEKSRKKSIQSFQKELWESSRFVSQYIKNLIFGKYRIACFSSYLWDSKSCEQLMWAHYAQSHKGFCVEYDISSLFNSDVKDEDIFPFYCTGEEYGYLLPSEQRRIIMNGFFPIHYSSKKIEISKTLCYAISKELCSKLQRRDINIKVFRSMITKTIPWKYEQEWRLIVDSDVSQTVNYKIPFPFARRIIVGVKASNELKRILYDTANLLDISYINERI